MQSLKFQLNTPSHINRDIQVEMTHLVTGKKVTKTPFLDGSLTVPGLDAGDWRVRVKHPNMLFDVWDRPIKVFKDRQTFVPIKIPTNIFENAPIRDIADANLGPVQSKLEQSAGEADIAAGKRGGDPIYADDWNALASTVGNVARATLDLAGLVSPQGHDHPEIAEKIGEIQNNLQRFYDVFASTLAELQRQIQELSLRATVETAIAQSESAGAKVPETTKAAWREAADKLNEVRADNPLVYGHRERAVGQKLRESIAEFVSTNASAGNVDAVKVLETQSSVMASAQVSSDYAVELANHKRSQGAGTNLAKAVLAVRGIQ